MIEDDTGRLDAEARKLRGAEWAPAPLSLPPCPPEWVTAVAMERSETQRVERAVSLPRPRVFPGSLESIARRWQRNAEHTKWKDRTWAESHAETMPEAWVGVLMKQWAKRCRTSMRDANLSHLTACRKINAAARAGVAADAGDAAIVHQAKLSARDAERRIRNASLPFKADPVLKLSASLWAVEGWLRDLGLAEAWERLATRSIGRAVLARAQCQYWWRRVLRGIHGRATEGVARAIGLVSKSAQPYASDDAVRKVKGASRRNAGMMDSTIATNEHGQQFKLSTLAAKSTSTKEIRRCELMTRIAGFELLARDVGHVAYFLTVTTPSRMHAYRTRGHSRWSAVPNRKFDGTTPDQAQRYLSKQWSLFRRAAGDAGLGLYGFRIAEPNHDGTPHWHMLFFMPAVTEKGVPAGLKLWELLRRYFLCNKGGDGDEPGAAKHRITIKKIDWSVGSAAGYIAKYISKNIDGHAIEKDLLGDDAVAASQRVEAWARTWGIRQFQQIGGAPVGVWRELRRLHREQAEASELIAQGLEAVNITADRDPNASDIGRQKTAAHGWQGYTTLQGGPNVKRKALRMRLQRDETGEIGRYGEVMPARVVGVVAESVERVETPAFGIVPATVATRRIRREVESERCAWVVSTVAGATLALARVLALAGSEAARPWSPVNNCTRPDQHPAPLFAPAVQRVPKKGRFSNWSRGRLTSESDHAPPQAHQRENPDPAPPGRSPGPAPERGPGRPAVH